MRFVSLVIYHSLWWLVFFICHWWYVVVTKLRCSSFYRMQMQPFFCFNVKGIVIVLFRGGDKVCKEAARYVTVLRMNSVIFTLSRCFGQGPRYRLMK